MERLEGIYSASNFIDSVYIHADPTRSCVVGVVVVASSSGDSGTGLHLDSDSDRDIQGSVKEQVLQDLARLAEEEALQPSERLNSRSVIMVSKPFSAEDGQLTSTGKLRRPALEKGDLLAG